MLSKITKITEEDNQLDTHKDHYIKLEVLNYLKKALINKDYANCRYIVQIARKNGAQRWELEGLISRYARLEDIAISTY